MRGEGPAEKVLKPEEAGPGSREVAGNRSSGAWGSSSPCPHFTDQQSEAGAAEPPIPAPGPSLTQFKLKRAVLADLHEMVTGASGSLATLE